MSVKGSSKSRVWCPSKVNEEDPLEIGVLPVKEAGFIHLGARVGSPGYIQAKVKERVDKVTKLLEKLPSLQNSHTEFVLLRACFSR